MVDPITPLFSVKFMQGERRRVFKAHLFSRGKRNQLARGGIILGCESLHPVLQHLSVAQLAQTAEQRFPGAAHSLPPRVGIDEPHAVSQGAATPRKVSQAAWFRAGSDLTRSRIICQAAMLRAPSGGGPIAKDTEHWEQKQIRCADDFCRGLIPTVCANMYTATDLCPASSSRLQRRQYKFSKKFLPGRGELRGKEILSPRIGRAQVCMEIPASLSSKFRTQSR